MKTSKKALRGILWHFSEKAVQGNYSNKEELGAGATPLKKETVKSFLIAVDHICNFFLILLLENKDMILHNFLE